MEIPVHCPKCQIAMDHWLTKLDVASNSVIADRCTSCGSLWFDEFELVHVGEALAKLPFQANDPGTAKKPARFLACPRCDARDGDGLVEIAVLDVVIDFCLSCHGVFFDEGECAALAAASREDPQNKAVAGYRIAPRVVRTLESGRFECPRCLIEADTKDALIVPAGLVCATCFYKVDEAVLTSSRGTKGLDQIERASGDATRWAVRPEPLFSHLGALLGSWGFSYCQKCGRRPDDPECHH